MTTDDGYIIMLHRILYPKGIESGPTGRPVLIQHGLVESSADWLLNLTEKSIGKLRPSPSFSGYKVLNNM